MEVNSVLKVNTFGDLDILYNNQSVLKNSSATIRIVSVLEYLVANHSTQCTPEQIVECLWPENEYVDPKKVLQTYVYRLRSIIAGENNLGKDLSSYISITNEKGSYKLVFSQDVELDTNRFIALIHKLESSIENDDYDKTLSDLLEVYKGNFMQRCNCESAVLHKRNIYSQMFMRGVSCAIEKYIHNTCFDKAMLCCEKVFLLDDLDEHINYLYLKTLILDMQKVRALRHFEYLRKRMELELKISPSHEIFELIHSLQIGSKQVNVEQTRLSIRKGLSYRGTGRMKRKIGKEARIKPKPPKTGVFLAVVNVENCEPSKEKEVLHQILSSALRKGDTFSYLSPSSSIVVFHLQKENDLNSICKRIYDCHEKSGAVNYSINVQPIPVSIIEK